jgi:hypothetical protein
MGHKVQIIFPVFLLCFYTTVSQGQQTRHNSIVLAYDDVSVGRNINVTYHKPWGRTWSVYAGLKYHINSKYYRNDYTLKTFLYKELYAKKTIEHFGIKAGIEKIIWVPNTLVTLFAYYDFQFTNATGKTIDQDWIPGQFPKLSPLPPPHSQGIFTYNTYENTFGLGLNIKVSNALGFRMQGGIGINHIKITAVDFKPDHWPLKPNASFIFSRQFAFGMSYALNRDNPVPDAPKRRKRQEKREPFNSINLSYDDIQTGRNLNIGYRQTLPTGFALYGALKYHINTRFYRDFTITEPYYFKQFRPEGLAEHLGLTVGLEKSFNIPGVNLEPFVFYELQAMRATVSNLVDLDYFYSGSSRPIDNAPFFAQEINNKAWFRKYGPVLALENYIGAGARLKVTDKINFKAKAGIGYNIYIGPDNFQNYLTRNPDWPNKFEPFEHKDVPWTTQKSEISRMFSLGLEYKIAKRDR